MPTKRPSANLGSNGAPLKRPAAAPGGDEDWSQFQVVPFTEQTPDETAKFSHLSFSDASFKKPPAIVKHLQAGTLNTSAGAQSIKDALRKVEKDGNSGWLEAYEGGTTAEKKQVLNRLVMCLDKADMMIMKKDTCGERTSGKEQRGWCALWEVANMEKIPFESKFGPILLDLVKNDKSRPHRNPELAAKGWREYYHVKDLGETSEVFHEKTTIAEAAETGLKQDEYDDAVKMVALGGGVAQSSSSTTRPATLEDKGIVSKWKGRAASIMQLLSDEEAAAKLLAMELGKHLGGRVVQRRHIAQAESWQKKLTNKRNLVLKLCSLLSANTTTILEKENNKYDVSLQQAEELVDSWQSESNKGMLEKLLSF